MYKTQTQIKLGGSKGGGSREKESSGIGYSIGGSSGRNSNGISFNCFKGNTTIESQMDDMVYRKPTRIIVSIDIILSSILLVVYLIELIQGSSVVVEKSDDDASSITFTKKQKETLRVLCWIGLFAICIFQLLVSGGTLGGTYERDGRKTLRNCRIWFITSISSVIFIFLQLLEVILFRQILLLFHIIEISILIIIIGIRTIGLILISKFIKELSIEFIADLDLDERFNSGNITKNGYEETSEL